METGRQQPMRTWKRKVRGFIRQVDWVHAFAMGAVVGGVIFTIWVAIHAIRGK